MKDTIIHSNTLPEIATQKIVLAKPGETRRLVFLFEKKAPEKMNLSVELKGKNSSIDIIGLYKGTGKMRTDIILAVTHAGIGTQSRVNFKAALEGVSRLSFIGNVRIEKNAKNADAAMGARALLLSDKAQAFIKPDLEILNHEVKASHGSSIGCVSPADLFYLQSRGLSPAEAKRICIAGFFHDINEYVYG